MQMLIEDQWVDASDGGSDDVLDKSTGQLLHRVPRATSADIARAVAAAQRGKRLMAALPAHRRCAVLMRTADAIEADIDDLATLLTRENGKTRREITSELRAAVRIFRGYAEEAKRLFGRTTPLDSIPGQENSMAITVRHPRGVVAAIVPFNYPIELWAHKVAGALAGGNAVITKPPEQCPLTLLAISRLLQAAGLPSAAHQVLTGPGEIVGAALVQASGIDMVAMTGSTSAGRQILRDAAETMKKVHLELGGNDATVICADADPQQAARALVSGRFTSGNGQICCAVKRVLIERAIFEPVLLATLALTQSLRLGDPMRDDTDVGPLIDEAAARTVEQQVQRAVAAGAQIRAGGHRNGAYFEPTVLTGLAPDAEVLDEEVFGPVLPLLIFDDFADALAIANRGPYGLQAAIFTQDIGRIMQAFRELDVGTVVVNHSTAIRLENLPFGGSKLSGNAREGLHDTLLEMTEQKTLLLSDVLMTT